MTRANFRDPLGLAWRMLRSPNRAARAVLVREALALALIPFDLALSPFERIALNQARNTPADSDDAFPLILVVGGPRSGTTLTSQLLARHLPVTYTSNWTSCFPNAPLTATRLMPRWARNPRAQATTNYFGHAAGLDAPHDAFFLWNRWLGPARAHAQPLTERHARDMRRFFRAWHRAFARPVLNKNNRNALCMDSIARALPGARFVVVRRDPVYVAQSLIEARREVQGSVSAGWGLLSRDADPTDPLGHVHAVCDQIEAFTRAIDDQLSRLPADRSVLLHYRTVCEDPAAAIEHVRDAFLPGASVNGSRIPSALVSTNHPRLTEQELDAIRARFPAPAPSP